MTDQPNNQLGQYRLIEEIGQGGMATVYKAYQSSLDRFVAIKVLPRTHDALFAARFKREARAIAQLQHHNILPVHDYGEQDGLLYLVMQYIPNGVTLGDLLGKPMEPTRALRLIGRILDALEYAHNHNVVHRDIKPSNILMSSPTWPMLADFGIVKLLNDDQSLTYSGLIVGTVAYMAPEQAMSRPVDARTDLYATGIMLYEMVTGRVPFDADAPLAMLMKQAYEAPPPPRSINPDLPAAVEAIILRALTKDPSGRYQGAGEMAAALERAAARIEQTRAWHQTTHLYETGAHALEEGRWDEAVEILSQLVALDPSFEDGVDLLSAAKIAQAAPQVTIAPLKAASDEQSRPVNAQQPRSGDIVGKTPSVSTATIQPPVASASKISTREHLEPQPIRPSVWFTIGGMTVLLVLIGVLASNIGGGLGRERPTSLLLSAEPEIVALQTADSLAESTIVIPTVSQTLASTTMTVLGTTLVSTLATEVTSTETRPSVLPTTIEPTRELLPDAVVNRPRLNMRAGPGQTYPIVDGYAQGTGLSVIGKERTGEWLQVRAPDDKVGWMFASFLQVNITVSIVPFVAVPTPNATRTPQPLIVPQATSAPPVATPPAPTPAVPVDTPAPTDPPTPADTPVPPEPTERKPDPPKPPRPTNTPRD
jgi:serine/threonine protein kinase/uncharacterized protein YraI